MESRTQFVYEYLQKHNLGKENGIKRSVLSSLLNINKRELRRITQEINESPKYQKLISTTESCFVCSNEKECAEAIMNTYKKATTMFKKANEMKRKLQRNGQLVYDIGQAEKSVVYELIETINKKEE